MKLVSFIGKKSAVTSQGTIDYTQQLSNAIDREIEIGHITDVTEEDRQVLIEQAQAKIKKVLAAGLKLCARPDGELRCFLLTRHDNLNAADVASELGPIAKYISDTGYYGTNPPTALTSLEIGTHGCWVFAVYDETAKGFRADMQAMFTGFNWSKQEEMFDAFAKKFVNAGTVFSLDHASQGLLQAHDARLPDWDTNALGRIGYNRFIKLPTEVTINGNKKRLFPGGSARCGKADWGADDWCGACDDCGVVALVG